MKTLNKLLVRQINKHLGDMDMVPEHLYPLLNIVSESYEHYEKDRKMLERSIELTSKEMVELNNKLRKETEDSSKEVFEKLKEFLEILNEEQLNLSQPDFLKLSHVADILKNETKKRKLAEKEKAQRQAHLEASQRIAHIGSWELELKTLTNLNNNPLIWSDETFRIFGYEPGTIAVSNDLFFSHVHSNDRQLIQEAINRAINTGATYDLEHRLILEGGLEKIVHERGEIVFDEKNLKPIKIVGTIQDITDRKRVKEELQKANDEFKKLFENMSEAFFSVDMESYQVIQMSPACEQVYGYKAEDFYNNPNLWFELIVEEDRKIITDNNVILASGQSIVNTYRGLGKDGHMRWLESKIIPTLNADGKLIRIDGATSDVTKRMEAQEALRNSEYLFRSMIENSSDAIMIVNEKSEVSYASNSLYRIMGYEPSEIIGVSSLEYIYSEDVAFLYKHHENVLANPGKTLSIVYRRVKKDGSHIWCEGSATNLLNESAVKGIVVNFRDITERIEYIDALKKSNEDLKKSNGELDRFVYSVSHDLRAPLSSMQGVIGFLESETEDPLVLRDVGLLKTSVNKLDGFILDILDYSRNARLEVKNEIIDFDGLIEETIDHIKFMSAGNGKIDIRTEINAKDAFYSDKGRISVVLNNVISNAIRYSNPDNPFPFVDIKIATTAAGAEIIISDNGIGISEENLPKVYDIFYRVSKKSTGSGLGLYIVKETIEKLNGIIYLESKHGEGTIFKVVLPNLLTL